MISMTTKRPPTVQDLHHHSDQQMTELRALLEQGAPAKPDPRRPGFFELQGLQNIFYVFKYPTGAKVLLLGVWERDPVAEMVSCGSCCSA
jgi:acyl-CoA-binding protein